ncbi:DNA gyrase inhibitor YacG [Bradyrhizobium sp. U87765 SZCCT0131]|uniref:DNA gyrase inhibitor YacG n=1 Tax=unclassified Bradyrhizobium TaxID=2631580 RepID=UPI001BAACFE0|nr:MULTISPECIES: DNA gyrase inhibitor YacG [unclassified Bradyrhizobium]MBR1220934.1 DNA gyrase inhibitor YacG [Bradyrhizobium sp. U87765 SZCCT0131]MBR1260246.1 DNA gyrase inhibitor YacG [Bradyrhizobium sp. U87765 SZCCT0134]MBR1307505.1 DNA gyrase inhibitor YacG [Bradyrhizobium sp. U87765 SZCCT0110]MBR1321459.1 DNA gyrase inhibitor YacG [Bradyrhizobium sp. U87765 SZCCT0109]MBR1349772.1 DNA gyrase inhibitor YacG [Bradyrhizobium sp. U87765 SZCCT0048]
MPPDDTARSLKKKGCPICGKPVVPEAAPFCSERCRKIDLGRWLSGSYVIPGDDSDDEADSIPQA